MQVLKKVFILLLLFVTINVHLPRITLSQEIYPVGNIEESSPKSISTPEVDLPGKKTEAKRSWLSRNKWWVLFGLAAVAGGVAAAGGGGGSGEDPHTTVGSIKASW